MRGWVSVPAPQALDAGRKHAPRALHAPPRLALGSALSPQPGRCACRRPAGRALLVCTATRTSAVVAKQRRIAEAQRQRGSQPRDAATWEDNTLVTFCRAARADAAVRKALELLEDALALDPNILLLCFWLPVGCNVQLTIQTVHEYAKIAARWRSRVYAALEVARASLQAEDVLGLQTALQLREQVTQLQDRVDTAALSALYEHSTALEGAAPAASADTAANEAVAPSVQRDNAASWLAAAENLKLYLEFSGATLDAHNRERLQLVFRAVLSPHAGVPPEMKDVWPRVEPTVVPPRRLSMLERNRRYVLAKQAYRLAVDAWKSATLGYRRTRRRVRAFRHELYRARREVRQEWR